MKASCLTSVPMLLGIVLCSSCASRPLAPPTCDLATAVPINRSASISGSTSTVTPATVGRTDSNAGETPESEHEVSTP